MSEVWTERQGKVLVATVDNPPVNALGIEVRRGLAKAVEAAERNRDVAVLLIVGSGPNFLSTCGADVRNAGKPPQPPLLSDLCSRIEACAKPVVVAMHGPVMGGGLEIALSGHYRLAVNGARLGLPDVQLGLMPGAGGTQRLPRLVGVKAALRMMLTGHDLSAGDALEWGLIDRLGRDATPLAEGLAYAQELAAAGAPVRRTCDAAFARDDRAAQRAALIVARVEMAAKTRGLFLPFGILHAVEAALEQPFEEGLRLERALFRQCLLRRVEQEQSPA
jgi:3-hydroxyacyl-CoA dehydrogenase